ncbi:MAG: hypothetical protein HC819_10355 [Cyclobacteriaceae bacterium]|nr:hypothetical protein [Cyclobacteriaceae bacterium]
MPIQISYTFFDHLMVFAGHYLAVWINGKIKYDYNVAHMSSSISDIYQDKQSISPRFHKFDDYIAGFTENVFRGLDYGVNLGIGYKLEPFILSTAYSVGIPNLSPGSKDGRESGFNRRHRVVSFSVIIYCANDKCQHGFFLIPVKLTHLAQGVP